MKKKDIYKLFYLTSILMLIGFFIRMGADYFKYNNTNSAPFYLFLIERLLEFIIPSIIFYIIGKNLKKKNLK